MMASMLTVQKTADAMHYAHGVVARGAHQAAKERGTSPRITPPPPISGRPPQRGMGPPTGLGGNPKRIGGGVSGF